MPSKQVRIIIVLALGVLTVLSGLALPKLQFAFSFEAFLPKDDPDLNFYVGFKKRFKKGEASVVIGLYNSEGVFKRDFLEKADKFTRKASKLPHVSRASSLTNLKDYIYDPFMPITERVLDWKRSEDLSVDSARIMADPRFVNTFISGSAKLMVVHLSTPANRTDEEEAEFNLALHELAEGFGFERWHAAGFPIVHYELHRLQLKQFKFFVVLATLVMLLSMVLLFRRFWGTIMAFFSVMLGMVYFFGMLSGIGHPLDLMSTLFPILLVIVGTSDVVHIMTKYSDELRKGRKRLEALKITIREIGLATFMTSITTAVGFLSLVSSRMPPIRNFGLLAALGVFMVFVSVILLSLSLLSNFEAKSLIRPPKGEGRFAAFLRNTDRFTKRKSKAILAGTLLFMAVCLFGASRISLSLTSQRDLPRNSRVLDDFRVIDKELKGVNSIDLAVEAVGEHQIQDLLVQRELEKLENYLAKDSIVGPVYSTNVYFRLANRAYNGNSPKHYKLPDSEEESKRQRVIIEKRLSGMMETFVSKDGHWANMSIKVPDVGSERVSALSAKIHEFIGENIDPEILRFRETGHRYIFDKNQEKLVASLMRGLGLAIAMVSLLMALVFRNIKMVIVSLIPNIVPLVVAAAIIGFLGLEFDPKVAIVFTVAFGIAVDDSIHFLARFKLERNKGKSIDDAIRATFMETGKAIVITTLILFFGFASLIFSAFPPTFTIGLLLSLTLVAALVADFLLLPISIRWLMKDKAKAKVTGAEDLEGENLEEKVI